jgi:hypothetical protein
VQVSTADGYELTMRTNRFLWRRRLRVWQFLDGLDGGNSILDLIIALPFLVLAVIALVELTVLIVLLPVSGLLHATGARSSDVVALQRIPDTNGRRFRARTMLHLPDAATAERFMNGVAQHVQRGGRLGDPAVAGMLKGERGRVVSGEEPWLSAKGRPVKR